MEARHLLVIFEQFYKFEDMRSDANAKEAFYELVDREYIKCP